MKLFLPFLLLTCFATQAQNADFITVKKKGKTIQTIFAGRNIEFSSTSGAYLNALINGIKNDTLYLQEFLIQKLPTTLGTYILDTLGSYHYKFHYNQVKAIGQWKKATFNTKGSGASLFGGSGTIWGTVAGALVIAVIDYGLVFVDVEPFWQFIAVGLVIIISVLVDQAQRRFMGGRQVE